MTEITKHCITCDEDGHTYVECKKGPFNVITSDALGLPGFMPRPPEYDETMRGLRERGALRDTEEESGGSKS